ncbi:unnamed protein product [Mesocestoides corti]|uniref:Uncharacterized protein n=1 Tax=Mesocestoides corti TaxID=53468 RepID=A0A158QUR5_MESCO|nr:unnamed protein product [Mesocestoides corti]
MDIDAFLPVDTLLEIVRKKDDPITFESVITPTNDSGETAGRSSGTQKVAARMEIGSGSICRPKGHLNREHPLVP